MPSITPETIATQSDYDAHSIHELQALLRSRLIAIKGKPELGSLRSIGLEIGVSHTWLGDFRDGKSVGINIMNRLANYFSIRYHIENYHEDKPNPIR